MKKFALVMAPVAAIALSFAGVSAHAQSTGIGAGTSVGGSTGIGTGTTTGTTNTPGSAGVGTSTGVGAGATVGGTNAGAGIGSSTGLGAGIPGPSATVSTGPMPLRRRPLTCAGIWRGAGWPGAAFLSQPPTTGA